MRRASSGLTDPDTIKNKLDNYARVAQLALTWNGSPVHWRGLNRAITGYCTYSKEPVPDWKGCGFSQLKPCLMHLASQGRIRFVGDYVVHPESEDEAVDVVGYEEEEHSEEEEVPRAPLNRSTSSTVVTHAKAISSPKLNKSNSFSKGASSGKLVNCPICQVMIAEDEVNRHLDECLNMQMINNEQQNGANNAANNVAAVPNNNNPRGTAAVAAVATVPQINFSQEDEDEVLHAPRRSSRGLAGLGKRRRSSGKTFAQNKRARVVLSVYEEEHYDEAENDDEEEEEEQLVHNNNNRLRMIDERLRNELLQAASQAIKQNNHVHLHLSDDSDEEDNANNAQGGGDSRFAEKILDRNLTDKECIICYMPMERGQLVATMRCFCQFHKECLLDWFQKREVCPTHSEMLM